MPAASISGVPTGTLKVRTLCRGFLLLCLLPPPPPRRLCWQCTERRPRCCYLCKWMTSLTPVGDTASDTVLAMPVATVSAAAAVRGG